MTEQLSLFDNPGMSKEELAQRLCDEFNSLETVWKGTFKVKDIELSRWDHISEKDKVLSITIKPDLNSNYLIQFDGDSESQKRIYRIDTPLVRQLSKDKDFSINITPWNIYIYYHKFERKKL